VTQSPSTTLETATASPSTTLDAATVSPTTTLAAATASPTTTLATVTAFPSTTLATVIQSPSTTVATVSLSASSTVATVSVSLSASTTVTTVQVTASSSFAGTTTITSAVPALVVNPITPQNGVTFGRGSRVTFTVEVTHYPTVNVRGAAVTVYVDGSKACSATSNASGQASCTFQATKADHTYVWYATATLAGYQPGRSLNQNFKTT